LKSRVLHEAVRRALTGKAYPAWRRPRARTLACVARNNGRLLFFSVDSSAIHSEPPSAERPMDNVLLIPSGASLDSLPAYRY
jgi:hypothetical protein